MDSIIGAMVTIGVGVIVIAGIYQLGQSGNPIVPAASAGYQATLSSLFK
jgi:hypothetical protein